MQTDAIRISDFPVSISHAPARRDKRIAVIGNPNVGKTTLFNRLTGSKHKIANYPGSTVEQHLGTLKLPQGEQVELIDLPGTYSLCARSPDEQVTIDVLLPWRGRTPDLALIVVDATSLERNLYFATQIIDAGIPSVVALNMNDQASELGRPVNAQRLARELGVPVIPIVANRGLGLDDLARAIEHQLRAPLGETTIKLKKTEQYDAVLAPIEEVIACQNPRLTPAACHARALWALLSIGRDELSHISDDLRSMTNQAQQKLGAEERDFDLELIAERYRRVEHMVTQARTLPPEPPRNVIRTEQIDRIVTHPIWGTLIFLAVGLILFESLFTGSEPAMRFIEQGVTMLQKLFSNSLPSGILRDLLVSGIIAGAGNVLVFVPQIAILIGALALLEDVGYLSRVAFLVDRLMKSVGLNGRAFIPLLSGFACAIPAITATRTIENRRDRLITIMVIPWTSCSARLPVYALIIATIFSGKERIAGILSPGSLILAGMYGLSITLTLIAASILRRTLLRGPRPSFILELPPYRRPSLRNIFTVIAERLKVFIVEVGTVVVALTIVLWSVLSFPRDPAVARHYEAVRQDVTQQNLSVSEKSMKLASIDAQEKSELIANSFGGRLGRAFEPLLKPLGFDWKLGVGILGSFAAREVFVSTLAIVYGVDADKNNFTSLRKRLRHEKRPDGSLLYTPLTGFSLMVFFLLACQCMSTLAVAKRESGSWRWPLLMFFYMTGIAYVASFTVYQVGSWMGLA